MNMSTCVVVYFSGCTFFSGRQTAQLHVCIEGLRTSRTDWGTMFRSFTCVFEGEGLHVPVGWRVCLCTHCTS